MKISIWQQFSSNNSVNYVVVGKFERAIQARDARQLLIQMLNDIADWYESQNTRPYTLGGTLATPIELSYQQRYGWEWEYGIDWMMTPRENISGHVKQIDNLLIIETGGTINFDATSPFEQLIKYFDGEPYRVAPSRKAFQCIVSLQTQTEQDAGELFRMVKDDQFTVPKLPHHPSVITKVERKRTHLTFKVTGYNRFADFITYLKSYKPKSLSYSFEEIPREPS